MNRTSKLWPGWNATIEKTEVKGIKSIGKFKTLQLFKVQFYLAVHTIAKTRLLAFKTHHNTTLRKRRCEI